MNAATDTAERILDAAAGLIASRGYAATTTRAIAERAGVNEVTLFRRFENKRGVLKALGERMARMQAGRAAEHVAPSDDARATLLAFARMEIEGALSDDGLAMRLAYDARSVPEVGEVLGDGAAANLGGLAEYLRERQEAGQLRADIDPLVIAEAFFGLTSSYVIMRTVLDLGESPVDVRTDEGIEQLFDLFWSGAAPKEARHDG
jgi:AcrR family transcriptional regulator